MSRCASGRSKPSGWNASSTPWCANSKVRATPRFRARTSANWSWKRCRHLIRLPISASPRSTAISGRRRISANLSGGSPRMTIDGGLAPATSLRDSTSTDLAMMRAALALARRGLGTTWPNPSVGCAIVNNGHVVGRGWTGRGGRPHGEREALRRAGAAAQGATAYVTLEPCSHWGQTPPCADALIAAGLRRVIVALEDPDARVAGSGIEGLRKAGLEVIAAEPDAAGLIDLSSALGLLGDRGLTRLLVEGGGRLAAALFRADLVDRLVWFHAPLLLGSDGIPAVAGLDPNGLA